MPYTRMSFCLAISAASGREIIGVPANWLSVPKMILRERLLSNLSKRPIQLASPSPISDEPCPFETTVPDKMSKYSNVPGGVRAFSI